MTIHYQQIPAEYWGALRPLVDECFGTEEEGFPLPSPDVAAAVVAVTDEGEVVGAVFWQLAFHAEPMLVSPRFKGKVDLLELAKGLQTMVTQQLPVGVPLPYHVFVKPGTGPEKLCLSFGMQPREEKAYVGVLVREE
jgi:hypothetical protein